MKEEKEEEGENKKKTRGEKIMRNRCNKEMEK